LTKTINGVGRSKYCHVLMALRMLCAHPYMFEGVEDPNAPLLGEHLINTSGKMIVMDKLLTKLFK